MGRHHLGAVSRHNIHVVRNNWSENDIRLYEQRMIEMESGRTATTAEPEGVPKSQQLAGTPIIKFLGTHRYPVQEQAAQTQRQPRAPVNVGISDPEQTCRQWDQYRPQKGASEPIFSNPFPSALLPPLLYHAVRGET